MKYIFLLTGLLFVFALHSQAPSGKAKKGTVYGAKTDTAGAVDVSALPGLLNDVDTIPVKVKGTVLEVCQAKGCWMTMRVDEDTEAFVKMKDYDFFVPADLAGKKVVLQGIAFIKTTGVEDLKHYAVDAGKSSEEIEKITEPEQQLRLLASGILVAE